MSADISTFVFAQILILGISAGVLALVYVYRIISYFSHIRILKFDIYVLLPYIPMILIVYSSHLQASCMDPGIIPRNSSDTIPQPPEPTESDENVVYKYCRM